MNYLAIKRYLCNVDLIGINYEKKESYNCHSNVAAYLIAGNN